MGMATEMWIALFVGIEIGYFLGGFIAWVLIRKYKPNNR